MEKVKLVSLNLDDTFKLKADGELYKIYRICGSVILTKYDGKFFCFSYNRNVIKC